MKYDISRASDNLNINVPLLVERHHVIDGMFLVCVCLSVSTLHDEFINPSVDVYPKPIYT